MDRAAMNDYIHHLFVSPCIRPYLAEQGKIVPGGSCWLLISSDINPDISVKLLMQLTRRCVKEGRWQQLFLISPSFLLLIVWLSALGGASVASEGIYRASCRWTVSKSQGISWCSPGFQSGLLCIKLKSSTPLKVKSYKYYAPSTVFP